MTRASSVRRGVEKIGTRQSERRRSTRAARPETFRAELSFTPRARDVNALRTHLHRQKREFVGAGETR